MPVLRGSYHPYLFPVYAALFACVLFIYSISYEWSIFRGTCRCENVWMLMHPVLASTLLYWHTDCFCFLEHHGSQVTLSLTQWESQAIKEQFVFQKLSTCYCIAIVIQGRPLVQHCPGQWVCVSSSYARHPLSKSEITAVYSSHLPSSPLSSDILSCTLDSLIITVMHMHAVMLHHTFHTTCSISTRVSSCLENICLCQLSLCESQRHPQLDKPTIYHTAPLCM